MGNETLITLFGKLVIVLKEKFIIDLISSPHLQLHLRIIMLNTYFMQHCRTHVNHSKCLVCASSHVLKSVD